MARNKAELVRHTQIAVDPLYSLGFGVYTDEIAVVLTQLLEFPGLHVNTARMEFWVPRSMI